MIIIDILSFCILISAILIFNYCALKHRFKNDFNKWTNGDRLIVTVISILLPIGFIFAVISLIVLIFEKLDYSEWANKDAN